MFKYLNLKLVITNILYKLYLHNIYKIKFWVDHLTKFRKVNNIYKVRLISGDEYACKLTRVFIRNTSVGT